MKFLSALLSVIFVASNALFVHAAETNLWAQRQAAKESNKKEQIQLASLPVQFLNQFPEIKSNLQTITENKVAQAVPRLPEDYSPYIEGISSQHGRLVQVDIPKESHRLVVLIQDVHANFEAQSNIVSLIRGVYDQAAKAGRPLFIGVEGAFDSFDFSRFQSFPHRDIVKAVADYFLEKDQISAPSYVGIVSTDKLNMKGIDDREHYTKNVEVIRSAELLRETALENLGLVERALADKKRAVLNPALTRADARWKAFRDGTFEMGRYVDFLQRTQETHNIQMDESTIQLDQFAAAYELETSLNFDVVNQQRASVLRRLVSVLKEKDMKKLVAYGLAYKAGQVSYSDYYRFVRESLKENKISLKSYPAFEKFIQYVLLTEGIQAEPLMKALYATEKAVMAALTENAEEKELLRQTEQAYLTDRLIQFSLIPEEWARYQDFRNKPILSNLEIFERFYAEADIRSLKIVENVAREDSPVSVLLVGGFHTNEIAHELKRQNIGYVIVQPQISQIADESGVAYLSIFTREKTPLEQMFKGQTLFVAPNALLAGAPSQEAKTSMIATVGVVFMALFRGLRALPGYAIRLLSSGSVEVNADGVMVNGHVTTEAGGVDVVSTPFGHVRLETNNLGATLPKTRIAALARYRDKGTGPTEYQIRLFAARTEFVDFYKNPAKFFRDHRKRTHVQKVALFVGMIFFAIGGAVPSILLGMGLSWLGLPWAGATIVAVVLYFVSVRTVWSPLMIGHIFFQAIYEVISIGIEKAFRPRGPPSLFDINETTGYIHYRDGAAVLREVLSDLITILKNDELRALYPVATAIDLNRWITREVKNRGGAVILDAHREFLPELKEVAALLVAEHQKGGQEAGFLMNDYKTSRTITQIDLSGFTDKHERAARQRRNLLIQDLVRGLVFQHLGPFVVDGDSDSNTTHQVATYVKDRIRSAKKEELEDRIQELEAHFARVTTNKMSDATTALWIVQNLRPLAEAWWKEKDDSSLELIGNVGRMESYGVFGNNGIEDEDRRAKETAEAIFAIYDGILNRHSIRVNDRIDGHPSYPTMLFDALAGITRIINDPAFATEMTGVFNRRVDDVIRSLEVQDVPKPELEPGSVKDFLDQIAITNGTGDRYGVLVDWAARSRRHPDAVAHIFVENEGVDAQGNERFHVIVSQRNRKVPLKFGDRDVPFDEVVRVLEYVQRRKFEGWVGEAGLGKIDSRPGLLVSYNFLLTAREIIEALLAHDFSVPFEDQSVASTPLGVRESTLLLNESAQTRYISFEAGVQRLRVSIETLIRQLEVKDDETVTVQQVNEQLVKITGSKNGVVLLDTNGMDPNAFLHDEFVQLLDVLAKKLKSEEQDRFKTLRARQQSDLDPKAKFGMQFAPDLSLLMRGVFEGVIFDHHGKFYDKEMEPNYDLLSFGSVPAARLKLEKGNVNTTMQVIQFMIDTIEAHTGEPQAAIAKINNRLKNVATDNYGDASWTVWIAGHVENLVMNWVKTERKAESDLATLYRVAWVEDFGIFGNHLAELANEEGAYYNPLFKEARDIVFATLLAYDQVLQGLAADRFVRPEEEERETENMGIVLKAMSEAVYNREVREQKAAEFDRLSSEDRQKWAETQLPRDSLPLHPLFDEFVIYPKGVASNGVFSSWHGAASQGSQPYGLTLINIGKNEKGQPFYMLILVLRNGEDFEILKDKGLTLTALGDVIKKFQIKKLRALPENENKKDAELAPLLFGRDALQVNFAPNSLFLGPDEIVQALNEFFHETFPIQALAKSAQASFEENPNLTSQKESSRFVNLTANLGIDIVKRIGDLAVRVRDQGRLQTEKKRGDGTTGSGETPVTRADKESNELARQAIKEIFPDHKFIGEEGADPDSFKSDFEWRLDPIDGTDNFVKGGKNWGVLLSLHYKGQLVFSINYVPQADGLNEGEEGKGLLMVGRRGKGIEINGVPFTAADRQENTTVMVASDPRAPYHDWLQDAGFGVSESFDSLSYQLARLITGAIDVLPSAILPNYEVGAMDMVQLLGDDFVVASMRRSSPDAIQPIDLMSDLEGRGKEGKLPAIAGKTEHVAQVLPFIQDGTGIRPQLTKDESIRWALAVFSFFHLQVRRWNIPLLYFLVLLIEAGQFFNPGFVKQHGRTAAENRVLYAGLFLVLFSMLGAGLLAFNMAAGSDAFTIALHVVLAVVSSNLTVHGLWIFGAYLYNPASFHSVQDLQAAQLVGRYNRGQISADDLGLGIENLYVPDAAPVGVSRLRNDLISTLQVELRTRPQEASRIIPVLNLLQNAEQGAVTSLNKARSDDTARTQLDLLFLSSIGNVNEVSMRVDEMAGQSGRVLLSIVSDGLPEPQLTAMQNKFANRRVVFLRQSEAELSLNALRAAAGPNAAGVKNINVFVDRGSALTPEEILALRSLGQDIRVDYYVLVEGLLASTMVVKSSLQAIEQYGQLQRLIDIQA